MLMEWCRTIAENVGTDYLRDVRDEWDARAFPHTAAKRRFQRMQDRIRRAVQKKLISLAPEELTVVEGWIARDDLSDAETMTVPSTHSVRHTDARQHGAAADRPARAAHGRNGKANSPNGSRIGNHLRSSLWDKDLRPPFSSRGRTRTYDPLINSQML